MFGAINHRIAPKRAVLLAAVLCGAGSMAGCIHVDPIQVEPITVNVNVSVKVDRDLDNFFAPLEKPGANTIPVTQPQ